MKSFDDLKNKLIADGILSPEQFERADENGLYIRLDEEYTISASPDTVALIKNEGKPWKKKSTHTHQDMFEGNTYEATCQIVKMFAEKYHGIFKQEALREFSIMSIIVIAGIILFAAYRLFA